MDIATLDILTKANAGVPVEIRHPGTKKPLGITLTVLGHDSDAYAAKLDDLNRDRREAASRGEVVQMLTKAELDERETELLIACVKAWDNMEYKGEPLKCTPDNVRMIFKQFPFVKEDVEKAVTNRANFLAG